MRVAEGEDKREKGCAPLHVCSRATERATQTSLVGESLLKARRIKLGMSVCDNEFDAPAYVFASHKSEVKVKGAEVVSPDARVI